MNSRWVLQIEIKRFIRPIQLENQQIINFEVLYFVVTLTRALEKRSHSSGTVQSAYHAITLLIDSWRKQCFMHSYFICKFMTTYRHFKHRDFLCFSTAKSTIDVYWKIVKKNSLKGTKSGGKLLPSVKQNFVKEVLLLIISCSRYWLSR